MSETRAGIVRGVCDDGETDYVPGINCGECGRFVGRDGHIGIATFEMSEIVAYVDGECARCLRMAEQRDAAILAQWYADRLEQDRREQERRAAR
jgi:hypothetical protein